MLPRRSVRHCFNLLSHDLQLVGFNSNQTPIFSSTNWKGNKKNNLNYKLTDRSSHTKMIIFKIHNYHILYLDMSIFINKTGYRLPKEH